VFVIAHLFLFGSMPATESRSTDRHRKVDVLSFGGLVPLVLSVASADRVEKFL